MSGPVQRCAGPFLLQAPAKGIPDLRRIFGYDAEKRAGPELQMIARMLTLAGGLAGAAGLSQFPEFSQQYTQRLAGAVDELSRVVEDFDRSAAAEGLDRQAALDAMAGSGFVERRRVDMTRTIERKSRLEADLAALRGAGPFTRAYEAAHFDDMEIARRAAQDFKPAMPLTFEGISFAAVGLFVGWLAIATVLYVLRLLLWPVRRRRAPSRRGRTA